MLVHGTGLATNFFPARYFIYHPGEYSNSNVFTKRASGMKTTNHGTQLLTARRLEPVTTVDAAPAPRRPRQVALSATRFRIARYFERREAGATGELLIQPLGNRSKAYLFTKRLFDVLGACALIVLLSPVWVTTLLILTVTTKGRPFYTQTRVGYCGRPFRMFKFRSMRLDADRLQHLVENEHNNGPIFKNRRDPRITRIGAFLRSTSIDEMPQLLNVLLGDMSLVGPRPPVPKEVVEYEPWQLQRLAVKPGLTCKWQVSGRSEIGFEDWVRMDIWYLENQNLRTDVVLLAKTPWSVLSRRGAY